MIQEVYIEFCGEIAHVMKGLCSISQQEDQPWLDGITCVYFNDIKIRYLDSIWLIYEIGLNSYMPHNFTLVSGFNAMQSCYNILKILTKDTPQLTYECNVWVPFVSSYYYCFTLVNTLLYIIQSSAAKLHMAQWWQWQNLGQTLYSQQTPHTSPSRASYGMSAERILENIGCVTLALHYIMLFWTML